MSTDITGRAPYQGLLQIFLYNRRFYARTFASIIVAIILSLYMPSAFRALLLLGSGAAVLWTCSSLLISHYIYDQSPLYSLNWLNACLSQPPARWVNIHSGLDETSRCIASMFPGSEGLILDIYDPREMTEPSIGEARRMTMASCATACATADWRALPAPDRDFDAAFLIFAAHELRHHKARVQLFQELARVLRGGGEVVLVEHLRDWANFLAFGPGFFHFFSGRTWQHAVNAAGLDLRLHRTVTPFVHVFVLRRAV